MTQHRSTYSDLLIERLRRATIGRYDIYAQLGAGGMATVYLALDLALDRKVAIKVLDPALTAEPENVARFKREAKVAASLTHPNVIAIHAVGDDADVAYFVMQFVEGRALDSVVREDGAQSVTFVRGVVAAAGSALHYAHNRGVVHRDVKPANLMLDREGRIVVADFGIAKLEDGKGLTMTGSVIGTPYYMAPEQFQGQPVTAAADQYALGVVAFELLTGRQPYAGATVAEVMKGHLFDPIPSVRSLRPDVPESIEQAITRMLAKEPAERFASLDDAVKAFGSVSSTQEQELRTQIIRLAQSGVMAQPQISVPLSPAPAVPAGSAARGGAAAPAAPAEPAAAPRSGVTHHASRYPWVLAGIALVFGVGIATAMLRPDLVNRARKALAAGNADLSDTGVVIGAADVPRVAPAPGGDAEAAKRARELRDSIEQAQAADRLREPAQRPIRDSLAALAAARRERLAAAGVDTARPSSVGPQPIPGAMVYARITVSSTCPGAQYSVDGAAWIALGARGSQTIEHLAGDVRLRVRSRAGVVWDSTFTVESGTRHTIGPRPTTCR
ncbi:MAG: serine/threonine protein kinase [Gemmatimonadaceae bacterium]|nr:serine/threonine protein kinase [Gemmatimonadaceae bacterium]MCW5825432.1 serine/threonine protein kinase [Gemmatimonadaceae bacterium]